MGIQFPNLTKKDVDYEKIAYTLITLCTGKYTKKDIPVTIIALLFIAKFVFGTM